MRYKEVLLLSDFKFVSSLDLVMHRYVFFELFFVCLHESGERGEEGSFQEVFGVQWSS